MAEELRRYVLTYGDDPTPYLGNAGQVAHAYAISDRIGETPPRVFYVTPEGDIREAVVKFSATPYDEHDWSDVTVEIHATEDVDPSPAFAPNGIVLDTAGYRVDGRA